MHAFYAVYSAFKLKQKVTLKKKDAETKLDEEKFWVTLTDSNYEPRGKALISIEILPIKLAKE